MAPKYQCPKCDKRFIDWGAEKLGYQCPDCDGEKLLQVGLETGPAVKPKKKKKPTLKRKKKVAEPKVSTFDDDAAVTPDDAPTEDLSAVDELGVVPDVEDESEDLKGLTVKGGDDLSDDEA